MSMPVSRIIEQFIAPVRRQVRLMILRSVITIVNDGGGMQRLQLKALAGVDDTDVEHFQPYGFWCVPLAGAEALYLAIGGAADKHVVGAVSDRRYRPTGHAAGESGLHFKEVVLVRCAGPDSAPELHLGADEASARVAVDTKTEQEIQALRDAVNALVNVFNNHVHPETGGSTGLTPTPATNPSSVGSVGSSNVKVNP